jgi:predicted amidohydrolase
MASGDPRAVRVAAVQMTSTDDLPGNLRTAGELVAEAAAAGAEWVALPENFAYLRREGTSFPCAQGLDGEIVGSLREMASRHRIWILGGTFPEALPGDERVHNTSVMVSPQGEVEGIYRKIHLFDVDLPDGTKLEESATVEPGCEVVATETAFGTLGLSVCYDVRFPELYRALVDRGAIALAIPAAFTLTTGKDHWHVLLRARAIEAQSYVLAAAQTGHHFGPRRSYGHALICDPWGTVLAECGEGEGVATAWIDPEVVRRVRAGLPSLRHRVLRGA